MEHTLHTAISAFGRILAATALAAFGFSSAAQAQSFPSKPIRIIMPYPAGGSSDVLMRQIGEKLTEKWRQPVIIDNKPGASGAIAAQAALQAPADGHTLLWAASPITSINPIATPNLPYDPKQLVPITEVARAEEYLIVSSALPVKDLRDFVRYAKQNPGAINYGSFGNASTLFLSMKSFEAAAGIEMTHVPYKGVGPATIDLVANRIQAIFTSPITMQGPISDGKLRVIALGSDKRSPTLPEVPTFMDQGVDFKASTWLGLLAPAGTPKPIVDEIAREVSRIVRDPDFQKKNLPYYQAGGNSPEDFSRAIESERTSLVTLVNRLKLRFDQ